MARRAFIAAPLIGTIIFLAAVLFVVNLNKIEAAESSRAVNDAYHNRVVSLMEIYRSDLAAIFRESISRNIEQFILEPGWTSLGPKNCEDLACTPRPYTYQEIRYKRCNEIKGIVKQIMCSIPTGSVGSLGRTSYKYGIPAWVDFATQSLTFEGISFSPVNGEQYKVFTPNPDDSAQVTAYREKCNALIEGSLFDCGAFSADKPQTVLQCCSVDSGKNPCPANKVAKGCEEGNFLVKISVKNPAVYSIMPRLRGTDGFGNEVRSGAIGDEDFNLPINVRAHKYDDYGLKLFKSLAYDGSMAKNEGPNEGIADGLCAGGSSCVKDAGYADQGFGAPYSSAEEASTALRDALSNGAWNTMKTRLPVSPAVFSKEKISLYIAKNNHDENSCKTDPTCKEIVDWLNSKYVGNKPVVSGNDLLDPKDGDTMTHYFGASLGVDDKGKSIAFFPDQRLNFYIIDENPAYRSRRERPNELIFPMTITHEIPGLPFEAGAAEQTPFLDGGNPRETQPTARGGRITREKP